MASGDKAVAVGTQHVTSYLAGAHTLLPGLLQEQLGSLLPKVTDGKVPTAVQLTIGKDDAGERDVLGGWQLCVWAGVWLYRCGQSTSRCALGVLWAPPLLECRCCWVHNMTTNMNPSDCYIHVRGVS